MFGHDDKRTDGNDDDQANPALPDDGVLGGDDAATATETVEKPEEPALLTPQPTGMMAANLDTPAPEAEPKPAEADKPLKHAEKTEEATPAADASAAAPVISSNPADLLSIKQDALKQLSPLVDHLNQTPEERFRTMMMMIQAADNDALIKPAYEAAQSITDEKVRAQALLDIINEINYFTQQHEAATA